MWYLISMDNGVIETASTKREIMLNHIASYREGIIGQSPYYRVEDESHDYYLFSSEEQATLAGFDWAFTSNGVKHSEMIPELDGKTHINIYSGGKTEIGRIMSNMHVMPFKTPCGKFQSVENYWHYLGIDPDKESGRDAMMDMKLCGPYEARRIGRRWKREHGLYVREDFQQLICEAVRVKCERYMDLLQQVNLPLVHYWVVKEHVLDQTESNMWWIKVIQEYVGDLIQRP